MKAFPLFALPQRTDLAAFHKLLTGDVMNTETEPLYSYLSLIFTSGFIILYLANLGFTKSAYILTIFVCTASVVFKSYYSEYTIYGEIIITIGAVSRLIIGFLERKK